MSPAAARVAAGRGAAQTVVVAKAAVVITGCADAAAGWAGGAAAGCVGRRSDASSGDVAQPLWSTACVFASREEQPAASALAVGSASRGGGGLPSNSNEHADDTHV